MNIDSKKKHRANISTDCADIYRYWAILFVVSERDKYRFKILYPTEAAHSPELSRFNIFPVRGCNSMAPEMICWSIKSLYFAFEGKTMVV